METQDQLNSEIQQLRNKIKELENKLNRIETSEQSLKPSDDLMKYIIEYNQTGIAVHDTNYIYLYVSQKYLDDFNLKREDVIGKHHYDVFPDLPQKWRDIHKKALQGIASSSHKDSFERENGTIEWTSWQCRPWYKNDQTIGGFIIYTKIITDQIKIEQALEKSRFLLNETGHMAKVGGWEINISENTLTWTDETFAIHELTSDQQPNINDAINFYHPDDRAKVSALVDKAMKDGLAFEFEARLITAKSNQIYVRASCKPFSEKGKLVGIRGSFQDITEQKLNHQKLIENQNLLLKIAENYPNSYLSIIEKDFKVGFTSGQEFKKLGLNPNDFIGLDLEQVFGEHTEYIRKNYEKTFNGEETSFELNINNQYQLYKTVPIYDSENKITRILSVVENITHQKKAIEDLKESEKKLQLIFNQSPFPTAFVEIKTGKILSFSESAIKEIGYHPDTTEEWFQLAYPDKNYRKEVIERWEPMVNQAIETKKATNTGEYTITTKYGNQLICEFFVQYIPDYLIVVLNDITERKKAENVLKESEERFRLLFSRHHAVMLLIEPDSGKILDANLAAEKFYGYTTENLCNMSIQDINILPPLDVKSQRIKAFQGQKNYFEFDHKLSSGKICPVEVYSSSIEIDGKNLLFSIIINAEEKRKTEQKLHASNQELLASEQQLKASNQQLTALNEILIEKENQFRALFNSMQEGFYLHKMVYNEEGKAIDYRIIEANPISEKHLSIKASDAIGKLATELYQTEEAPFLDIYSKVAETGEPYSFEQYFEPMDKHFFISVFSPQKGSFATVFYDITDSKNYENELLAAKEKSEENEKKLLEAQKLAHLGNWEYYIENNTVNWSKELFNIFERPYDLPAPKYSDQKPFYTPDSFEKLDKAVQDCIHNGTPYDIELDIVTQKGTIKQIISKGQVLKDIDNVIIGCYGTAQDITEKKEIEKKIILAKELAESKEEKFRLLNRLTSDLLALDDTENIYKFIGESLQKLYPNTIVLNVSVNESLKQTKLETINGLDHKLFKKVLSVSGFNPIGKTYKLVESHNEFFKSGNFVEFKGGLKEFASTEFPSIAATSLEKLIGLHKIYTIGINKDDGLLAAIHFFTFNKQEIKDSNFLEVFSKQIGLVLQKKIDEQELLLAKEKAEESQANITAIIEGTNNSIWAFDRDYKILYINNLMQQEFLKVFNVFLEPGMSLIEGLPEQLRPFWKPRYDRVLSNEQFTVEDAVPSENGTIYIEVTFNPIIKDGKVIGGSCIGNDITARKMEELELIKAKEKAEESEEKFRTIFNMSQSLICIANLQTSTFKFVNPSFERVLGYSSEELLSKPFTDFVHPDDLQPTIDLVKQQQESGLIIHSFENRYKRKNGEYCWLNWNAFPVPEKGITYSIAHDVTLLKENEKELIKAKEKAEAANIHKNYFLANMSHEIRTPMNGVLGFTNLLLDEEFSKEEQTKYLHIIERNSQQLLTLIDDIIDIAKIESNELKINFNDCLINNILTDLEENFNQIKIKLKKEHINLKLEIPAKYKNLTFRTDPNRLRQVISNLLNNAFKFSEDGTISFGFKVHKTQIEFYVKDQGIGIPQDKVDEIFERFKQLNYKNAAKYGGTGLGLAISRGIIHLMGGDFDVKSQLGQGSTFKFKLPLN